MAPTRTSTFPIIVCTCPAPSSSWKSASASAGRIARTASQDSEPNYKIRLMLNNTKKASVYSTASSPTGPGPRTCLCFPSNCRSADLSLPVFLHTPRRSKLGVMRLSAQVGLALVGRGRAACGTPGAQTRAGSVPGLQNDGVGGAPQPSPRVSDNCHTAAWYKLTPQLL